MFMDIQLLADLDAIWGCKQQRIDEKTTSTIVTRKEDRDYNYQVGDMLKLRVYDPSKLEERFKGPYRITQVFTNGTVHLQIKSGITTSVNMQKIKPQKGVL